MRRNLCRQPLGAGAGTCDAVFLKQIDISNFRGIRQLSLQLGETTVLIGENNTGKSTILDALRLAMGRTVTYSQNKFTEYDHYLSKGVRQAADGDAIEIVLHFGERRDGEWPDDVAQQLSEVIQYDGDGLQSVILRVQGRYDESTNETSPERSFLDLKGQKLRINASKYMGTLQKLVPVFSLKSIRDVENEFRPSSSLWGPFVRSTDMPSDVRRSLEVEIAVLNEKIIGAHGSFGAVKEQLEGISKLVLLADSEIVTIEALTGSVHDVLSRTKMLLTSITGANIPIGRHGEGTHSLAIMCLLVAFLHSKLHKEYAEATTPVLTLEEPEAHLHPSAAHSVTDLLQNPSGQSIITTHSGDLVSGVKLRSLRRLSRKNGKIFAYHVDQDQFNQSEVSRIEHHIKTTRGNILFARCWLLVEGKTDRMVFERCADACQNNLTRRGIYCIEYAHIGKLRALIRFARQLGIEWFIVADGDDAGSSYAAKAGKELDSEDAEAHIFRLEHTLDVLLCLEGYGHYYEDFRAESPDHAIDKDADYWKEVISRKDKTDAAMSAVEEMCGEGGKGVPETIRRIIDKSVQLARKSGQ